MDMCVCGCNTGLQSPRQRPYSFKAPTRVKGTVDDLDPASPNTYSCLGI